MGDRRGSPVCDRLLVQPVAILCRTMNKLVQLSKCVIDTHGSMDQWGASKKKDQMRTVHHQVHVKEYMSRIVWMSSPYISRACFDGQSICTLFKQRQSQASIKVKELPGPLMPQAQTPKTG